MRIMYVVCNDNNAVVVIVTLCWARTACVVSWCACILESIKTIFQSRVHSLVL